MTKKEEMLPFEVGAEESSKTASGIFGEGDIFGLPASYSGTNRKKQLAWNKRGVALAYLLIPTLKSAVDVIATNLASTPMVMKDKSGYVISSSNSKQDSPFLEGVRRSYSFYREPLFKMWATAYLLYGEVFSEKVPSAGGMYGLRWLNPLSTSIEVRREEFSPVYATSEKFHKDKLYFRYGGQYGSDVYTEDEVLYNRNFNPIDDYRGYSDGLAALGKANIRLEFDNFTLAFYANNGHPSLIVSPRDKLIGQKNITEWQNQWQNDYAGSANQFKTLISGFPFDVQPVNIQDVSKPLEISKEAKQSILTSFRVPPSMVGDSTDSSFQFSKETKNAFMQTVVKPIGMAISESINQSKTPQLFGEDEALLFGFDFSEFENVAKSDLDQQEVLERRLKSGGISMGAYQKAINADITDGAMDTYLVPDGFTLVKAEALADPTLIPGDPKMGAPNKLPSEQENRATESTTEEPESLEFNASKSAQKGATFDLEPYDAISLPEDEIFIQNKYDLINFNPPQDVVDSAKKALTMPGLSETAKTIAEKIVNKHSQMFPDFVYKVNELQKSVVLNLDDPENLKIWESCGGKKSFLWTSGLIAEISNVDLNSSMEE